MLNIVTQLELESKNNINNKLLETMENIGNNTVKPNPLPIPKRHLEDNSNDTNESERNEIIVPEINNTNNEVFRDTSHHQVIYTMFI